MIIRAAILRAADRIEREPGCYDFARVAVPPPDGGCPACMWGWIGYELGMYGDGIWAVSGALGLADRDLYEMWESMEEGVMALPQAQMRAFADRYFPETSIPESVRAIFTQADVKERAA